ncbi:bifunctional metallophosphatase/5'-nucleotidase [Segetibacter sp. 3557_3]|uniref:bifunctional metallophosphatase/5'-nucleotidase n=1 Tax=Segetibacter sp. 3557_3 TaxID=2547429 RepID=UPI0010587DEF|nr:bifunctional metallophosphatase/5'-nucleotidase [Segetibacter sp. 3557_3]TDH20633.1 bifunctional metallophosphatase/5'-nucleotidase [Segetibacter sp. 3557_3]
MKQYLRLTYLIIIATGLACTGSRRATGSKDDGKIEVVFVQVNDVYEIAPLAGGKEGGMARVATLKKQYQQANPNTFLVMAGDFLSPSVYNSLSYEGKRVRGRQMVDAMNAAGMDFVVFGNHEFDINETELQDRINESGFQWIASNTFHLVKGQTLPFEKTNISNPPPFPQTFVLRVKDADGTTAKVGFIGLTLPFNKANHVTYTDPIATAKTLYNALKDTVDAVVAITHQLVDDDIRLAKEIPWLAAILGGHEHDMRLEKAGNVYITKAHANAKSAYVVKLQINKKKRQTEVKPELKYLNETFGLDRTTNEVVQKWVSIADSNYASLGFNAKEVILQNSAPLDGREAEVRRGQTNLTALITAAMAEACPQADIVLMNAGSIRVDDILLPPLTQYDIIRTLPFGGGIREVDMKGILLQRILEAGRNNVNLGGYLQAQPVNYNAANRSWRVGNQPLDVYRTYRVAMSEFLLTGGETNLGFLTKDNPDIVKVYDAETGVDNPKADLRLAVVKFLKKK